MKPTNMIEKIEDDIRHTDPEPEAIYLGDLEYDMLRRDAAYLPKDTPKKVNNEKFNRLPIVRVQKNRYYRVV